MLDETVTATEANRSFSRLLRSVEGGAAVTITKDGRPVAVMQPAGTIPRVGGSRAREQMLRLLEEGLPIGHTGALDRDALHTR